MKFEVIRTSDNYDREKCPHPKTKQEYVHSFRALLTSQKIEEARKHKMFKGCDNFTKKDGIVIGRTKDKVSVWTIKFRTLSELLKFIDECNEEIILSSNSNYKDIDATIEIYDDYRE